ncbi:response regulator [Oleispirillum naphthae]|uniref:response regulator n=1 Tax=Oleispirillum naphthae TaxID=2838853 RepID=UPI0030825A2F
MSAPLVLVVEDTGPGARLMGELVALAGGRAALAANGAEALRLAAAEAPALVLMDLRLPDGDGREWARRIRSLAGLESVPVWACSGLLPEALLAEEWADVPFSGWIGKPFEIAEVLAKLRAALARP